MTAFGIKLVGIRDEIIDPPLWVQEYDPDVRAIEPNDRWPYPTGMLVSTDDPADARRFDTFAEAVECWRQQSTVSPFRPDGLPNRPLTAFTVEISRLPEET